MWVRIPPSAPQKALLVQVRPAAPNNNNYKGNTMKINLRKSAALQTEIMNVMGNIEVATRRTYADIDYVETDFHDHVSEWKNNLNRKWQLVDTLENIRKATAKANQDSGVSDLLTEERVISQKINFLSEVIENKKTRMYTVQEIVDKLKKYQEVKSDSLMSYRHEQSVTSGLITKEEISVYETEIKKLKKLRQKTNDQILELNVSTLIDLSESDVRLLEKEELI